MVAVQFDQLSDLAKPNISRVFDVPIVQTQFWHDDKAVAKTLLIDFDVSLAVGCN